MILGAHLARRWKELCWGAVVGDHHTSAPGFPCPVLARAQTTLVQDAGEVRDPSAGAACARARQRARAGLCVYPKSLPEFKSAIGADRLRHPGVESLSSIQALLYA